MSKPLAVCRELEKARLSVSSVKVTKCNKKLQLVNEKSWWNTKEPERTNLPQKFRANFVVRVEYPEGIVKCVSAQIWAPPVQRASNRL